MTVFTKTGVEIASATDMAGNTRVVVNGDMQIWMTEVERLAELAFTAGLVYDTRAGLYANLIPASRTPALVIGDPTPSYDGLYMKLFGSGTGSWQRLGDVPGYNVVRFSNIGTGTPNAIVATPGGSVSAAAGAQIYTVNIVAANTGDVTLNGKPLLTSSGNQIAAGGLQPSMNVAFLFDGTNYRLLSDQASAAIVAAAEAAAVRAEVAAASISERAVFGIAELVALPIATTTAATMYDRWRAGLWQPVLISSLSTDEFRAMTVDIVAMSQFNNLGGRQGIYALSTDDPDYVWVRRWSGHADVAWWYNASDLGDVGPALNAAILVVNQGGSGDIDIRQVSGFTRIGNGGAAGDATFIRARSRVRLHFDNRMGLIGDTRSLTAPGAPTYFRYTYFGAVIVLDGCVAGEPVSNDPYQNDGLYEWEVHGDPQFDVLGAGRSAWMGYGPFHRCKMSGNASNRTTGFVFQIIDDSAAPETWFDGLDVYIRTGYPYRRNDEIGAFNVFPKVLGSDGETKSRNLRFVEGSAINCLRQNGTRGDLGGKLNLVRGITGVLLVEGTGGEGSLNVNNGCDDLDITIYHRNCERGLLISPEGANEYAGRGGRKFRAKLFGETSQAQVLAPVLAAVMGRPDGIDLELHGDGELALSHFPGLKIRVSSGTGDMGIYGDTILASNGATTTVTGSKGGSGDLIGLDGSAVTGGTVTQGDTFEIKRSGLTIGSGTIAEVIPTTGLPGLQVRGATRRGSIRSGAKTHAGVAIPHRALSVDLKVDGQGHGTASAAVIGNADMPVHASNIRLEFANPPNDPVTIRGDNNALDISSDGVGTYNANSRLFTDYGKNNRRRLRVSPSQTKHAYYNRQIAGSSGAIFEGLAGPATLKFTAPNTDQPIARGNLVLRAEFASMAAASETRFLYPLERPAFLIGAQVIYPAGTTASAGKGLAFGIASDPDYAWRITSGVSQAAGAIVNYGRIQSDVLADAFLNESPIPAGEAFVAWIEGGKTGADPVVLIAHLIEIMTS